MVKNTEVFSKIDLHEVTISMPIFLLFQDVTVEPRESSHFEFYAPGQDKEILPLRESALYLEDWIGLKQMDEAGKLHFYDIPGGHLQLSLEWFKTEIIHKFFM